MVTSRQHGSVDHTQDALRRIGKVSHQHLNALSVDVIGAGHIVALLDVRHLVCEALSVQVLLRVVSLVLNHVVGNHYLFEAGLLAMGRGIINLFVASVQAEIVLCLDHLFGGQVDLLQYAFVKRFLHCPLNLFLIIILI